MGGSAYQDRRPAELWERRPGGHWLSVRSGTFGSLGALLRRQLEARASIRFDRFDSVEYVILPVGEWPDNNTEPSGVVA